MLVLRLMLFAQMIVLVVTALAVSRDYQDNWILEGLEIPFAVFMLTNVIYFLTENDSKWLVLLATLSRVIGGLVPNLKYEWFLGTAADQNVQFRLARFLCDSGNVESGFAYSETPIMHIFLASYSKITGISLLHSFKYLPAISWLIYPIMMYSIINKIFPKQEKSSLMRYALLFSSIPINSHLSYTVSGTLFGSLLVFLFLSEFLKASKTNTRQHIVLALVFSLTLVMSHFISSILLLLGFLMVFLADRIFKIFQFGSFGVRFSILLTTLNSAWIMIQLNNATVFAEAIELTLGNFVRGIIGVEPRIWSPTGIRFRLFELSFLDSLRVLTVFHGGDVIVLLVAALGIVAARRLHSSKPLKFLSLYFLLLWLFVPLQLVLTAGTAGLIQYFRVVRHTLVICPIFGAVLLYYIDKRVCRKKPLVSTILLLAIALGTVQMYGCQLLLPSSSAISESLPSDEPVVFLGMVGINSIYQRSMIRHIEKYASEEMQLASDYMTRNQIIGLADYEFSVSQVVNYNPLSKLVDENTRQTNYNIFLIHFPGKAGGLAERAEIRTEKLILETVLNSSTLYTNGESCVLIYPIAYARP